MAVKGQSQESNTLSCFGDDSNTPKLHDCQLSSVCGQPAGQQKQARQQKRDNITANLQKVAKTLRQAAK